MTKLLITLPCTAQELENALHAVCHYGLWGAKVEFVHRETIVTGDTIVERSSPRLVIETEAKGEEVDTPKLSEYIECVTCKEMGCPNAGSHAIMRCRRTKQEGDTK